jgi:hypothetical protein
MPDAGYLMLVEAERRSRFSGDIAEFTRSETQNIQHPESSIQDDAILPMFFIATP